MFFKSYFINKEYIGQEIIANQSCYYTVIPAFLFIRVELFPDCPTISLNCPPD